MSLALRKHLIPVRGRQHGVEVLWYDGVSVITYPREGTVNVHALSYSDKDVLKYLIPVRGRKSCIIHRVVVLMKQFIPARGRQTNCFTQTIVVCESFYPREGTVTPSTVARPASAVIHLISARGTVTPFDYVPKNIPPLKQLIPARGQQLTTTHKETSGDNPLVS